ncbi:hypothetical protein [Cutibacterium sp. V947]|uniref:hypothetical protein n=1 Tax=Cutibacterium sp. V947 TaxID=3446480 RepID=UPI003EE40F2C
MWGFFPPLLPVAGASRAFGIGIVAVVVLMPGHSSTPLISLGLAMSFGFHGLVKKVLGVTVNPTVGLTVGTLATTPLAFGVHRVGRRP